MLPVSRVPGGQPSSSLWHMCALPSRPPLKQRRVPVLGLQRMAISLLRRTTHTFSSTP